MSGRIFTEHGRRATALLMFAGLAALIAIAPATDVVGADDTTAWVLDVPAPVVQTLWAAAAAAGVVGALWCPGLTGDHMRTIGYTALAVATASRCLAWALSWAQDLWPGPPAGHPHALIGAAFWAILTAVLITCAGWRDSSGYRIEGSR